MTLTSASRDIAVAALAVPVAPVPTSGRILLAFRAAPHNVIAAAAEPSDDDVIAGDRPHVDEL